MLMYFKMVLPHHVCQSLAQEMAGVGALSDPTVFAKVL